MVDKYFTSPSGETNHCNKCKKPIWEKEGRYHVIVQHDIYINGERYFNGLHGSQTFCEKCYKQLFGKFKFKDSETIYKKIDVKNTIPEHMKEDIKNEYYDEY